MSTDCTTSGGQPKESQSSKGGPKVILLLGQSFNVPNFENMLDKEKEVALTAWLKNNVKDGLVTSTKHSVSQKVEPMDAQSASIKLPHNSTPTTPASRLVDSSPRGVPKPCMEVFKALQVPSSLTTTLLPSGMLYYRWQDPSRSFRWMSGNAVSPAST